MTGSLGGRDATKEAESSAEQSCFNVKLSDIVAELNSSSSTLFYNAPFPFVERGRRILGRIQNHTHIEKLLRLWHTLRYLRPRQVAYQVFYRLTGRLTQNMAVRNKGVVVARSQVHPPSSPKARPPKGEPLEEQGGGVPAAHGTVYPDVSAGRATFHFLNRSQTFPFPAGMDWNFAGYGKLWTYNLNYFEFLAGLSFAHGQTLINEWIAAEATHHDGWEPYPTSLRLVSWRRFYAEHGIIPGNLVLDSLRRQYRSLWRKLEYHLGGNHLLENAIALSYTARFLGDDAGLARAARLLQTELAAQYLADGGHYERSPMYQLILTDRLLTLYGGMHPAPLTSPLGDRGESPGPGAPAPASAPPNAPAEQLAVVLRESLEKQLGWLVAFCTTDGRFAHFNDSIGGIAPGLHATLHRATALGLQPSQPSLDASGYRRLAAPDFDLWIDVAAIGPDDIPGHAHADTLTFELHHAGQPLIVDAGISTYEKNARRAWERSTAAHNTVSVGGRNSSDVWGGFRVGKRARVKLLTDHEQEVVARHNGYPGGHQRSFLWDENRLLIRDTLAAGTTGVARFHFDHSRRVTLRGDHLRTDTGAVARWAGGEARLVGYEQATGWNECRPAICLEISFTGSLEWEVFGENIVPFNAFKPSPE